MKLVKRDQNFNQNWLPSFFNDFLSNDWIEPVPSMTPAINIKESKTDYMVEFATPGITKNDVNVHLQDNNTLVISVEKKEEKNEHSDAAYIRYEFSSTSFKQSFSIPDDVQKDSISAKVDNGILSINLPKYVESENKNEHRIIEIQ